LHCSSFGVYLLTTRQNIAQIRRIVSLPVGRQDKAITSLKRGFMMTRILDVSSGGGNCGPRYSFLFFDD